METPALAHAHWVSPEQSNVSGPFVPKTYGFPRWRSASLTAMPAAGFGAGARGMTSTGGDAGVAVRGAAG